MGTEKRERQKANRAARLEEQQAAAAKAKRRQQIRTIIIVGVALVVAMVLISALSGCASEPEEASDATTTTEFTGDGTPPDEVQRPQEPATELEYGTGECPPAEGVDEPVLVFDDAPQQCIDPAKTYTATIETSEGTVVVDLDTETTPITTNNFVTLARNGYFDGTDLFRTEAATGIIQGGSPHTQDNTDPGPGYFIPSEGTPFAAEDYKPGTLAMANAGPGTAGSQFFFVSQPAGSYLGDPSANGVGPSAGSWAVFGQTTEGLDVLQAISDLESSPGSGVPSKPVTVESVTITES